MRKKKSGGVGEEDADPGLGEPELAHIPGMGLGATPQAIRWARLGRHIERLAFYVDRLSQAQKRIQRGRGRPKLDAIQSKDAMRAYYAWRMLHHLRKAEGKAKLNLSNRDLIQLCRRAEASLQIPAHERVFPEGGNHEPSVSRGKTILEIDGDWQSEVCEKIEAI